MYWITYNFLIQQNQSNISKTQFRICCITIFSTPQFQISENHMSIWPFLVRLIHVQGFEWEYENKWIPSVYLKPPFHYADLAPDLPRSSRFWSIGESVLASFAIGGIVKTASWDRGKSGHVFRSGRNFEHVQNFSPISPIKISRRESGESVITA